MAIPRFPDVRNGPSREHRRNLPHWEEDGAAYFVTFRLADSLPAAVQREVGQLRERAVTARQKGNESEARRHERALVRAAEDALDRGYGACVLRVPVIAREVRDTLLKWDTGRYDLYAWCVMPNHVHAVVCPNPGHSLSKILHSWKSYTSSFSNEVLGRTGTLWQSESFDHLIRSEEHFHRFVAYTLANPTKAGLTNWPWVGSKPLPNSPLVARAPLPVDPP